MLAGSNSLPALLEDYLRRLTDTYDIATQLVAAPELKSYAFTPMAASQLLRIVQETLTNVRKHPGAQAVNVSIAREDSRAETMVRDDGAGFDPCFSVTLLSRRWRACTAPAWG
jgi:signal transduction histidine kinase